MRVEVMIPISSQMLEGLIDRVHCPLPSKLRSWDRIEQQACVRNRGCKRQDWMSWNNSWVSCTDYKTTRWDTVMLPGTVTAWSFTVKWQLLPNIALHWDKTISSQNDISVPTLKELFRISGKLDISPLCWCQDRRHTGRHTGRKHSWTLCKRNTGW